MATVQDWAVVAFFFCLSVVIGSIVWWSWRNGISPMPTSHKAKRCLFAHLPSKCTGNIYELGSGWGTLVFSLAKQYPNCQVIGLETSPFPFMVSKILLLFKRLPNVHLKRRDFFSISLKEASLVVCYLYPKAMQKLKIKFEKELAPGTWVISNTFSVPGWVPLAIYEVNDLYRSKIYVYQWQSLNWQ